MIVNKFHKVFATDLHFAAARGDAIFLPSFHHSSLVTVSVAGSRSIMAGPSARCRLPSVNHSSTTTIPVAGIALDHGRAVGAVQLAIPLP
jgi:hypothetical protein